MGNKAGEYRVGQLRERNGRPVGANEGPKDGAPDAWRMIVNTLFPACSPCLRVS